MKKVLQTLLDESEHEEIKKIATEDSSSDSAAGRKVILAGLKALNRE